MEFLLGAAVVFLAWFGFWASFKIQQWQEDEARLHAEERMRKRI